VFLKLFCVIFCYKPLCSAGSSLLLQKVVSNLQDRFSFVGHNTIHMFYFLVVLFLRVSILTVHCALNLYTEWTLITGWMFSALGLWCYAAPHNKHLHRLTWKHDCLFHTAASIQSAELLGLYMLADGVSSSETSVNVYETKPRSIPDDRHLQNRRHGNVKSLAINNFKLYEL
jgi:hypothetical protein